MRAVWQYEVPTAFGEFALEMPCWPTFLAVQVQGDRPVLWAEVETGAERRPVRFLVVATGQVLPAGDWWHIGTYQRLGGSLVCHLYYSGWSW